MHRALLLLCVIVTAAALGAQEPVQPALAAGQAAGDAPAAEQLLAFANQTRTARGLSPLAWDSALATAALKHCRRMAVEGPLSHRYNGELDLAERAGQASAHFSLIEENIALGASPTKIHEAWMQSLDHRANLLNPQIDHVGIAVVEANGVLYAVADYSRGVQSLDDAQVEAQIGRLLQKQGVTLVKNFATARGYCASNGRFSAIGDQPLFMMRWQDPDISHLPAEIVKRLESGDYPRAAVGSCAPQGDVTGFTIYRVAVLLYGPETTQKLKSYY